MLKFISFGSGSSGNCYLLFTERDALLIDVGIGVRTLKKYFSEYGLQIQQVHHVLITHDHADHVKSVGAFSNDYHVPVYATYEVHHGIEENYCVRRKIQPINAKLIELGKDFTLGDFHISCFNVPHDSNGNVGYMIEHEGIVFCLITDAGHVTEEMKSYIRKANYLILEANHDEEMLKGGAYPEYLKKRVASDDGHLSNIACAEALAENATPELKHVWLCHLSEENNHPELARKTVEMVLRNHGIIAGKDFLLDVLKRNKPSELYDLT